jgi:hypothetical protein
MNKRPVGKRGTAASIRFTEGPPKTEPSKIELPERKHSHYYKDVRGLAEVDVYRVLRLFDVTDPCVAHAIKKLLVAGKRGAKTMETDIAEVIVTLVRWQEMYEEDNGHSPT